MDNKLMGGRRPKPKRRQIRRRLKMLNQGSYGCVYRPGISCLGKIEQSNKYVTKLQKVNSTSTNEIQISKILINNIPETVIQYAPILSSCPIALAKINPSYIEKCEVVHKKKNGSDVSFTLNKMRYVGKDTLETYIIRRINKISFLPKLMETHIYLLSSIIPLIKNNIVHFDIKENNVIYDTQNQSPIIIDFGLSINMKTLQTSAQYQSAFYVYYEKYPPWCLEIIIISYIVKNHKSWQSTIITNKQLTQIILDYFANNDIVKVIRKISKKKTEGFQKNWTDFVSTELSGKTGKQIVDKLITTWKTWDIFGLSVMYLFIWERYNLNQPQFNRYRDYLVQHIGALPHERMSVEESLRFVEYNTTNSLTINDFKSNNINNINMNEYNNKYQQSVASRKVEEKIVYNHQ